MRVVIAVDKFRGTATAPEVADALARGARDAGWAAHPLALADGGEGLLEAFGGANRATTVTGPTGAPVRAAWRLDGDRAVVESARASGLALAGGAERNDPLTATSAGTGELIAAAIAAGARHVVVGAGGSAMSDGGLGAIEALGDAREAIGHGTEVVVAVDVTTRYLDAATVFGPQKGADPAQVAVLDRGLHVARDRLRRSYGLDPQSEPGSGAAGGLAGALYAVGAEVTSGFELVAELRGLESALDSADLVLTGEGRLDRTSLRGKVVGGVRRRARARGLPATAVVGVSELASVRGLQVVSLTERFGAQRAWNDVLKCLRTAAAEHLAVISSRYGRRP